MAQATAEQLDKKFGIRYYEALRLEALAGSIGKMAVEGANLEALKHRRRVEVTSLFAEAMKPESLRSVIDTHYVIEMQNGQLVADDGEPIAGMLQRAREKDERLAAKDQFFEPFLLERTNAEIAELADQEAMVRGETNYNTLVKFSPYSEEFDDGTEETRDKLTKAEQKPYWQRAMARVAHAHEGKIHIFTISIDNSSVELLKETARQQFDYEFEATDSTQMLGESIKLEIGDDSWRWLSKKIARTADEILEQRHQGRYKQGNPEHNVRQAQEYVESQTEILEGFLAEDVQLALQHSNYETYETATADKIYNAVALLEIRLESGRQNDPVVDYAAASGGAGDVARAEGKSYDACGLIIGSNSNNKATIGQKSGFESLLRLENKKITCAECNKKVVVPKEYLEKGHLYCKECGCDFDVCTGQKTFLQNKEKIAPRTIGAFELFMNAWRADGVKWNLQRLARRQKTSTDELEQRRLAKKIQAEAAEFNELQRAA